MNTAIQGSVDTHPDDLEAVPGAVRGLWAIGSDTLLAGVLDELDYGVMLLNESGALIHANDAARSLLDRAEVFVLDGARPVPSDHNQRRRWRALLAACAGNERRLDIFVSSRSSLSVAVVPIAPALSSAGSATVLATFGRQRTCEPISLNAFARAHRLSATETRVLASLASGLSPSHIALEHGVSISTVRTQIKQVLAKTAGGSIRELLNQMSRLAPMRERVRRGSAAACRHG